MHVLRSAKSKGNRKFQILVKFDALDHSATGRSGDLLGAKRCLCLVDDPPGKAASKIRHDQPDLERSSLTISLTKLYFKDASVVSSSNLLLLFTASCF